MAGRKPSIGDKARTEKIMFYITPEMLSDLKAMAFLEDKSMVECIIGLIEKETKIREKEIHALKKIQIANSAQ